MFTLTDVATQAHSCQWQVPEQQWPTGKWTRWGRMRWVEVGQMRRNVSMRDHISNCSGLWRAHKPCTGNRKSVQHLDKSCLVSTPAPEHIFYFRGQRCILWHRSIPERLSPFSTGGDQLSPSGQKNGRKIRIYPKNCLISKASHGFCSKFPCLCFTLGCYMQRVMVFPSSKKQETWSSLPASLHAGSSDSERSKWGQPGPFSLHSNHSDLLSWRECCLLC